MMQAHTIQRAENEVRKRIEASGNPDEIDQLCLDGIQIRTITPTIKRLIEGCLNLSYLTLNYCELISLENFPHLKNLVGLQMVDNRLTGIDLSKICQSPSISYLMLDNNLISSISVLRQLSPLKQLEILEVHGNQICETQEYRKLIFDIFPSLNIVDFYDRDNNLVDEEYSQDDDSDDGNSNEDLFDHLEDNREEPKNDPPNPPINNRTGNQRLKRSYSLETEPSPAPVQSLTLQSFLKPFERQKQIMMVRTALTYDESSSEEDNDLVKQFIRKFTKRQEQ